MTSIDITREHNPANVAALPKRLADIVGDIDAFFADVWTVRPQLFQYRAKSGFLSQAEIWATLDCGQLVGPYLEVLKDGVSSGDVTVTRNVLNRPMPAYADCAAVRAKFASGHAVRLNAPEHWHAEIKELLDGLRTDLRAEVRSSALLSPPDATSAHTDDAHLFVLQLEGQADWSVGDEQRVAATLRPGEVLYVPSGQPHQLLARGGDSLHLAIAATPPTARDLVELVLAGFVKSQLANEIAGTHHAMTLEEKVGWLRVALAGHLSTVDLGALVDRAVKLRQRGGQA